MTDLTPLADRVLLEADEGESVSRGGIIIPDMAKEKPHRGRVLAVGPGRYENGRRIDTTLREGDTVLYGKYVGTELELDGRKVVILRESDVIARLDP